MKNCTNGHGDQGVAGWIPAGSATFFRGDLTAILSLPLTQEGQLSVSGENMHNTHNTG